MILIPTFGMDIMFVILLNLPKDLPDWIIYGLIVFFLIVLVVSLLLMIKKWLNVPCKTFVNESGISFKFEKKNFFYKYNTFFSGWENVTNISDTAYNEQGNFYQITFKNPSFTANFSAIKTEEEDAEKFFNELTYYQDLYNLSHPKIPISSKNFYESTLARMITLLFYILVIAIPMVYFTTDKNIDWWRVISLFCFGSIWVGNYYKNTKKLY
ncbi:hypothetical protein EZ428_01375 [Pedobacter frigiditerrae]|uniref:Uncharacterized protein n=1 Tax=Pedobacter frigiditerrae TaxID=2530452 RepID=A0A4R0N125_9SPHI|nr:hypothetical protein [Pedobacter frigiditerrae]TCC93449.1 hypothetical protein EZ428_01375 [Pedobacter frigiditerrae]